MDINTLINIFAETLANDNALNAWTVVNYSPADKIKVFVGGDVRNPPGEDECPYLMLVPMDHDSGRHKEDISAGFGLVCCVLDDSSRTHAGYGNITEYVGTRNAEALRKLAVTAIARADIGNAEIASAEVEYDPLEQFPFHINYTMINIIEPVTLDVDPLIGG